MYNKVGKIKIEEKTLLRFALIYCVFQFTIVLIRSVITGLVYDEAFTYMKYVRVDLFNIQTLYQLYKWSLANNHWLNTILIYLTQKITHVEYCEFIIRLPQLFFLALYLIGSVYGWRKKHYSFAVLILLISNYYLLEFYGLARGYGMANTLVFFSILSCGRWYESNYRKMKYLNWVMFYMSLAVFSNTITLLLYPAFGIICLIRLIQEKQFNVFIKKCGLVFFLFLSFSLIMVKYHMNISAEGLPLYTGGNRSFFDSVVKGFVFMFVRHDQIASIIAIIIVVGIVCCLVVLNKKIVLYDYILMLAIFTATNYITELIFHKGFIATRELLPFYSFAILCLNALFIAIKQIIHFKSLSLVKNVFTVSICMLAFISSFSQINIFSTHDFASEYVMKENVLGINLTGVSYPPLRTYTDYAEVFYQQKLEQIAQDYLAKQERNN